MSSKWTKFGVCLALLGMMPTHARAVAPYEPHSVGSWKITRVDDACWAYAVIDKGAAFAIALGRDAGLLAVSNDGWEWLDSRQGETLPITYDFGEWTIKATGQVGDVLGRRSIQSILRFSDGDELWRTWASSWHVDIFAEGNFLKSYVFAGDESGDGGHASAALELARCMQTLK